MGVAIRGIGGRERSACRPRVQRFFEGRAQFGFADWLAEHGCDGWQMKARIVRAARCREQDDTAFAFGILRHGLCDFDAARRGPESVRDHEVEMPAIFFERLERFQRGRGIPRGGYFEAPCGEHVREQFCISRMRLDHERAASGE